MLYFILGCMTGGTLGVFIMCLFTVSGQCSREEERKENKD
jgi:hypothetical protein